MHRAIRFSFAVLALVLVGGLIFLTGCITVGPDYQTPKTEVPEKWQPPPDPALVPGQAEIRQWWTVFEDPQLTSLIQRASLGNLDLKAAVAKVKAARALVGVAAGKELPSLDANGQASRQQESENVGTGTGPVYNRFALGLESSWEIDLFGRIRRTVEAAQADYQASEEDRLDLTVSLLAEVARTYFTIRSTQERLAATSKNIESQKQVLELTRSRFRNGLATDLDVSQAESVLASSQASLPPLRIALARAMHALSLLLGLAPKELEAELSPAKPIPTPPEKVAVGLPADLLRRRPDIRRAERQLAAATARIGVATADLYPSFSLTGQLGLNSSTTGSLFDYSSHFFYLGLPIKWNIFAGGAIRSQIKVQEAQAEQALYNYQNAILKALGEVEDALTAYVEQRHAVRALERTVTAARRTLKLAVRLYKDGLKDFQGVLDAQRSLLEYENQLAQARGDADINLAILYKSLGGGWSLAEEKKAGGKNQKAARSGANGKEQGSKQ